MTEAFDPADFYDERVMKYGLSAKSLGWKDFAQQELRFEMLVSEMDLDGKRIIDFGCGFGDFANFLISRDIVPQEYIGVDVSLKMLNIARKNVERTGIKARFLNLNIFHDSINASADVAFMSGLLNLRQSNKSGTQVLRHLMSKIRPKLTEALVFNLLTDNVTFYQPHHRHYNPQETEQIVKIFFQEVSIRENYGLYEFTVKAIV